MMAGPLKSRTECFAAQTPGATRRAAIGLLLARLCFRPAGDAAILHPFAQFGKSRSGRAASAAAVRGEWSGQVGLLLPLSASGNAGVAAHR